MSALSTRVDSVRLADRVGPAGREGDEHIVKPGADALVFTGIKGGAMRRANFNPLVGWTETVRKLGVPGLHFHDLRHTGNHFAARSGVSTKELMARMGHDDMRAALIYQRATAEADKQIADRLSAMVDKHRSGSESTPESVADDTDDEGDDGAAGSLVPTS